MGSCASERGPSWVCALILAATAAFKAISLVAGTGLLAYPHPFLPGTYRVYVWLGLAAEMAVFAALVRGRRIFLLGCFGLSIVFVGYHALGAFLRVSGPCMCLGGLLGHWRALAQAESPLSFLLACGLLAASFVGVFGISGRASAGPGDGSLRPAVALIAVGAWLLAGTAVVWLWHGRFLGGDEGMEAAKSLQILHGNMARMWNDQPPLWSMIGAGLFRSCGPSLSWGRLLTVLFGALLPLTWAAYWSRHGLGWAAVISAILLWLADYACLGSFMLEAPAYAVGLASLLPLVLAGPGWLPLSISAVIAATGLSIKLTASFALVVPFAWLCQRSLKRGIAWGLAAVGLLILGSLLQPGWSWSAMLASQTNFGAKQAWNYPLDPAVYADAWLICLLAVFAIARGRVTGRLAALAPWLWAAAVALLIHLFHRPFWSFYDLHLLAPVAVAAGVGAVDLWQVLRAASIPRWERSLALGAAAALCLCWGWQQGGGIVRQRRFSTDFAASPVTRAVRALGEAHHAAFAMQPLWTFAAGRVQTPPELTVLPLKRFWCGQISNAGVVDALRSNGVGVLVVNESVESVPAWTNLLAGYVCITRDASTLVFAARSLRLPADSSAIEKEANSALLRTLGF